MGWRAILDPSRLARVSMLGVAAGFGLGLPLGLPDQAWGQSEPQRRASPLRVATRDAALHRVQANGVDLQQVPREAAATEARAVAPPKIEVTQTIIRTEPVAVPGARLSLDIDHASEGARFEWMQVAGPTVEISDPTRPSIQVTIPEGTDFLGFVLIVARPTLVKVVKISVPVQRPLSAGGSDNAGQPQPSWGTRPSSAVKADAGDDPVGLVGHRVTLNGSRSIPGDGKTARWVQIAGPAVVAPEHRGAFFSFVPSGPGLYRFLMVVAGNGEVSEPDEVAVLVGSPPAGPSASAIAPTPAQIPTLLQAPTPAPQPTPEQILSGVGTQLPDAARVTREVADVMAAVADRSELYTSFGALQSELMRRLDVVVPAGTAERSAWVRDVFNPLTAHTAAQLLAVGIDLRQPQGSQQPLSPAQQAKLQEHFQRLARAFRAVPVTR